MARRAKRRRVTAAATAARQLADQLLPIPCAVTSGRVEDHGLVFVRRCLEREGHLALGVPHRWSGFEPTGEKVSADVLDKLGDTF